MSDTPRTDGCLTEILDAYGYVHQGNCPQRWVNHSRELERELNAANDRIDLLTACNADVARIAKERDDALDRIKRLEEFVDQLTNPKFTRDDLPKEALLQYIKRLEEAGDALYENSDPTRWDLPEANARKLKEQEAWRKAKEAKP